MVKILTLVLIVVVTIVGFTMVKSYASGLPPDTPPTFILFVELLPILLGAVLVLSVFTSIVTPVITRHLKWRSFGNRMKEAYTAKFGYPNPAFNQEIDQHIKAVETLGKGYTKSIDMDWLKRMAEFTEIPFIIPEEEYLSEEEKTSKFDDDTN